MPETINIESSGLAACCCATLLARSGISVRLPEWQPTPSPTLLLNGHTLRLLEDVFGLDANELDTERIIRRRIVQWQPNTGPTAFPHFGMVVNQGALLAKLWQSVPQQTNEKGADSISFSIRKQTEVMHVFGTRQACATIVRLRSTATDACWMEGTEDGWLFLMPQADDAGILLSVGSDSTALLAQSKLIAPEIMEAGPCSSKLTVAPCIADPFFGTSWLVCGGDAIGFDPICGEGAGNAIREGILASAVIREWLVNKEEEAALTHYATRLVFGFKRHLETCLTFYKSAYETQWWKQQEEDVQRGLDWTNNKLHHLPPARFRLEGFDLVKTSAASRRSSLSGLS